MPSYNPKAVEPRWQRYWEEHKTFRTPDDSDRPKYYVLDMFPYPSGAGLHVGHPEGYTATDILARYRRMRGDCVLHPIGWDAFGLPAEEHARKTGTHPRAETQKNIDTFRRQIKMLGFSYDWDREVDTTDPAYFKWTQWIFLVLFDTWYDPAQQRGRPIAELPVPAEVKAKGPAAVRGFIDGKRLAYQAEVPVNWCPALGTVLANEEVIDGKSERGDHPVVRMPLRQWLLRITDYADRLLADLDQVDWPEPIKKQQREWIGRSEGAEVDFALKAAPLGQAIRVFTTRPDTLYGATYMVLAPEHPLVDAITTPLQRPAVQEYQTQATRKSDRERTELAKTKTGVFTGAHAVNPVNGEAVPIWVADYVLAGYGTGAIMAVPAHDERDFAFAQAFGLPIRSVVLPSRAWLEKTAIYGIAERLTRDPEPGAGVQQAETLSDHEMDVLKALEPIWSEQNKDLSAAIEQLYRNRVTLFAEAFTGEGTAINSGPFDGLPTAEFKRQIIDKLHVARRGRARVHTKLRDWLFSRQRYWGEPFPILHEVDAAGKPTGAIEPLTLADLPLELPALADYQPTGNPEAPLSKAKDWLHVTRNGKRYVRETNTMPQWAGSCWYYLRYIDPRNDQALCDPAKLKRWLPVDLYVGGAEHAVLHLLYSRFWHKVLFDRGHVPVAEPFQKLVNQGMILGETDYHVPAEIYEANETRLTAMGLQALRIQDDVKDIVILRIQTLEPGKFSPLTEEQVAKEHGKTFLKGTNIELTGRAEKMSKSRGNVINPDHVVDEYGADSMRLYEMFMGPLEATKPWSMRSVEGVYRFLSRVWRLIVDERAETTALAPTVQDGAPDAETRRRLHHTIQRVTDELDALSFNTAIAAMMELTNHLTPQPVRSRSVLRTLVLLLAPFAPHLAEELWQALGGATTLAYEPWPTYDPALLVAAEIEVPIQINGKLRAKLTVPAGIDAAALEAAARADERVRGYLDGKTVRKVIVAPGNKLVNFVVS